MNLDKFTKKIELLNTDAAVVFLTDKHGFVLIKRKERIDDPWSGHMALPGGFKKAEETIMQAAERECFEEVGIKPEIEGSLGVYIPLNRKIRVQAFYAFCKKTEEFKISDEVEKAFWVDEKDLKKADDCYYYREYKIWGLTYRILSDIF
ncbi:MAG: NUDIX domain-containing protein [Thermoplasmata archaeon]